MLMKIVLCFLLVIKKNLVQVLAGTGVTSITKTISSIVPCLIRMLVCLATSLVMFLAFSGDSAEAEPVPSRHSKFCKMIFM